MGASITETMQKQSEENWVVFVLAYFKLYNQNQIVTSSDCIIQTKPVQLRWRDQKENARKSNEEGFIGTLPLHSDENDVQNW